MTHRTIDAKPTERKISEIKNLTLLLPFGLILFFLFVPTHLFSQNYNVYFGDLHEHSIHSWDANPGALSPAAAYAYAKHIAQIDFMAITDHTNGLSESNFQNVRAASQKYNHPDSQFVAIAGQELGSLGGTGYGHMNIFEPLTRADNSSDNDTRYNLSRAYQFLIDNQLPGQFNHPSTDNGNSNFQNFDYFEPVDLYMNTLEVINGRRSEDYERYYLLALENGWHVGAVGDQDNHAGRYGDNVSSAGDIYLTGVLVDSLTKPKVLDAIRKRRTYAFETSPATDRMFLTEFTADGRWLGDVFDNDDNQIDFKISARANANFISAQLYKNNLLIKTFTPNRNDFAWQVTDSASFGSVYYFLKLIQEDADVLWSSPIWVNSPGVYESPDDQAIPIAAIRENLQNGLPRHLGWTNITIRGVGTAGNQFGTSGPGYIQDETGGVAVFGSLFAERVIPGIDLEFEVTGVVSFFNGLTEIVPYSVTRIGRKDLSGIKQVTTNEIATNGENYEGQLIVVANATVVGNFPPGGSNANITMNDGSGPCTLRIDGDTNISGTQKPSGLVNVTGIVSQFDTSPPYNSGYQLLPRSLDDIELTTGIDQFEFAHQLTKFELHQNYPNPFNAETSIFYTVPNAGGLVSMSIFDMRGQLVKTLMRNEEVMPGEHRIVWDGKNDRGEKARTGIYLVQFNDRQLSLTRKMLLLQ